LFSKDAILHAAESQKTLWALGLFTAALTAFYTVRLGIKVFHGQPRDAELFEHAHESPSVMTIPMALLAVGTIAVSILWVPAFLGHWTILPDYLQSVLGETHEPSAAEALRSTLWAVGAALLGVIVALWAYAWQPGVALAMGANFSLALPLGGGQILRGRTVCGAHHPPRTTLFGVGVGSL
jgi:NADH-quinone oxidoreductase subunit L